MTSETGVLAGSSFRGTTRVKTSRSVKMPASRSPSITRIDPMCRLFMRSIASMTVVCGVTTSSDSRFSSSSFSTASFMAPLPLLRALQS